MHLTSKYLFKLNKKGKTIVIGGKYGNSFHYIIWNNIYKHAVNIMFYAKV